MGDAPRSSNSSGTSWRGGGGVAFYQPNNKKYARQYTASSVPLITKFMGLTRTEDPSCACPYARPDENGLVEADCPRGKEYRSDVVIPFLYHLENFPKLINIWGGGVVLVNLSSRVMILKRHLDINSPRK